MIRLAVSGTYSSGKTFTVMALSHYTGVPRTLAKTIREIMPDAVPGKALWEVTPAEFLQLAMRRHVGRAVHEATMPDGFISDGSSLQEWIYGAVRVRYGMNPSATAHLAPVPRAELSAEMLFFEQVVAQYGHAFKQHVAQSFDAVVHLRNELGILGDGHRPMNQDFRDECDTMLLDTLTEIGVPHHVVGGPVRERLTRIAELFDLPRVRSADEAIELASAEYARLDLRLETERAKPALA
ncbi:AAA family ATPase [Actinokineospora inagensis]|uniref:AAA family ATPase n=1 Tax=Actinokineospora inagensis TaxID=103730 RepID=UPI000414B5FB|nr:AAA family ATPase [Actinokineospora inagensis]